MAGISAGPHPFFRISPAEISKAQCFAVKRGEVATRIDAKYHALRENFSSPFPLVEFETLVWTEPDYGLSARAATRTSKDKPRYIRITDFGEDGIEPGHEFVTANPIKSGYELSIGDILFARSGSVGKTYLHEDISEPAIFSGYCIRFRFDKSKASPKFVYWWTKTSAYSRWVAAIQHPSVQPNINKEEFKSCQIPLPPISEQGRLVATMDAARAERKANLEEANALLAGLDDFLLDTLGITSPPEDFRRVFAVNYAQVRKNNSLNPDYYHPERILSLSALGLTVSSLAGMVNFKRNLIKTPGENYLGLAHIQSNTGELTDSPSLAKGTCFTYQANDVLFARLRPYLNKVYRAEMNGCCSTEFLVLRVKNKEVLMSDYLAAVLRSRIVLAQTVHMMTGNILPRLANADVANLMIPIPALEIQKVIATEVRRRREESRRLRSKAESGWQDAKRWFEKQLLGSVSS